MSEAYRQVFSEAILFSPAVRRKIRPYAFLLEEKLGRRILPPKAPQLVGAFGAALLAREES
jgi:hypothetical protein